MIRRPLNTQFSVAVRSGRKVTTIRDKAWPLGRPIMLFNWSGVAYRSKQVDVAVVVVSEVCPVVISRDEDGVMRYMLLVGLEDLMRPEAGPLHESEGFASQAEMDEWFRPLLKAGTSVTKQLMRFELVKGGCC